MKIQFRDNPTREFFSLRKKKPKQNMVAGDEGTERSPKIVPSQTPTAATPPIPALGSHSN